MCQEGEGFDQEGYGVGVMVLIFYYGLRGYSRFEWGDVMQKGDKLLGFQ